MLIRERRVPDLDYTLDELVRDGAAKTSYEKLTNLRQPVLLAAKEFFSNESKYDFVHDGKLTGYFPVGSEKALNARRADSKEYLHFSPDVQLPPRLAGILSDTYSLCEAVAETILRDLKTRHLLDPTVTLFPHSESFLRLIRYHDDGTAQSAAPHTDINLLSLLLFDDAPGLWFQARSGKRIDLDLDETNFVSIAGDMLELATNGKVKATTHGVKCTTSERYSVVFFANPASSVKLSNDVTAGEALARRLEEMKAV